MSLLLYRVFSRALIVFFACALVFMAQAQAATGPNKGDDYLIKGITVDVQGSSALDARDKAYTAARRTAWQQLVMRLSPKDAAAMPLPEDKAISSAIKDFSIENERMTTRRYLGTVNIRFKDAAAKKILGSLRSGAFEASADTEDTVITGSDETGTAMRRRDDPDHIRRAAENAGPVTLVLPWYNAGGRSVLWGQANPWRAAWEEKNGLSRERTLVLPVGDVADMRLYSPAQPLSQGGNIDGLMKRYRATSAILAMAEPLPDGSVNVALYRYSGNVATPVARFGIDASARDTLGDAVAQSADAIKSANANTNMPAPVQVSVAPGSVSVPQTRTAPAGGIYRTLARFSGLQEWVAMRQALSRVPGMGTISVHSISPSQANLEFDYKGDAGALMNAFAQNGLQISMLPQGLAVATGPGDVQPQFMLSMGRVF